MTVSESYFKPCRELEICDELIEKYFNTQQYEKCFEGHLALAEQGYPLAECQVGYFYYEGLGVEKDLEKEVWWTRRAADHGDRVGLCKKVYMIVRRDVLRASEAMQKKVKETENIEILWNTQVRGL